MDVEHSTESPTEAPRRTKSRPRWRRFAIYFTYLFLVTFVLAEIISRVVTRSDANGILHVGSLVLLPFRLEANASTVPWAETPARTYIKLDDRLGWSIMPNGKS